MTSYPDDPDPYFLAEVSAGPMSWSLEGGPGTDLSDGYGLADPLKVSWKQANSANVYAHAEPMSATFSVVVPSLVDLEEITRGAAVVIRVYGWEPGTLNPDAEPGDIGGAEFPPLVVFRGRVVDKAARRHPLGVIARFVCVDWTVDLAEALQIGVRDWPAESNNDRWFRIWDEAGLLAPAPLFPGVAFNSSYQLNPRSKSPTNALAALQRLIEQTNDGPALYGRASYLVPNYVAGWVDADEPGGPGVSTYALLVDWARADPGDNGFSSRLPALLVESSPGFWTVEPTDTAGGPGPGSSRRAVIVPGSQVELDGEWSQTKQTDPESVTVTGSFTFADLTVEEITERIGPDAAVSVRIEHDGVPLTVARSYLQAHLAGSAPERWRTDPMTWRAYLDPWPLVANVPWFIDGLHQLAARQTVTVSDIGDQWTPDGRSWYAGRLTAATFTLSRGRYVVDFELDSLPLSPLGPDVYGPGTTDRAATWSTLAAVAGSASWSQLDPRVSWIDARLVRKP